MAFISNNYQLMLTKLPTHLCDHSIFITITSPSSTCHCWHKSGDKIVAESWPASLTTSRKPLTFFSLSLRVSDVLFSLTRRLSVTQFCHCCCCIDQKCWWQLLPWPSLPSLHPDIHLLIEPCCVDRRVDGYHGSCFQHISSECPKTQTEFDSNHIYSDSILIKELYSCKYYHVNTGVLSLQP